MSKRSMTLPAYKAKASCVEFCLIRPLLNILYGILSIFVFMIYGFIIGITSFVNCFTVVCSRTHWKTHYNMVGRLSLWIAHMSMYLAIATDDNPPICP